jgi:hypothetical protein
MILAPAETCSFDRQNGSRHIGVGLRGVCGSEDGQLPLSQKQPAPVGLVASGGELRPRCRIEARTVSTCEIQHMPTLVIDNVPVSLYDRIEHLAKIRQGDAG